jgi:hypothetical protein
MLSSRRSVTFCPNELSGSRQPSAPSTVASSASRPSRARRSAATAATSFDIDAAW